jgi:hypothetical protein
MCTKTFFFMISMVFCFSFQGYSADGNSPTPIVEKIYVQPSQLHITHEGIYFLNEEGDLKKAICLLSDAQGIYILASVFECPVCRRPRWVGVCKTPTCPLYGIQYQT